MTQPSSTFTCTLSFGTETFQDRRSIAAAAISWEEDDTGRMADHLRRSETIGPFLALEDRKLLTGSGHASRTHKDSLSAAGHTEPCSKARRSAPGGALRACSCPRRIASEALDPSGE